MIEVRERFKEGRSPPLTGLRKKEHNGTHESLSKLIAELEIIRADSLRLERKFGPRLAEITEHKMSARNLVHYLALRRQDIRPLQEQLAALGLSSLGRTESHVLGGIESLLKVLHQLVGREWTPSLEDERGVNFAEGKALLRANTDALLGPPPRKRSVRIMVTMPREAADDYQLVRQLLANGMDCMRINCAHDDAQAWTRYDRQLARGEARVGQRVSR